MGPKNSKAKKKKKIDFEIFAGEGHRLGSGDEEGEQARRAPSSRVGINNDEVDDDLRDGEDFAEQYEHLTVQIGGEEQAKRLHKVEIGKGPGELLASAVRQQSDLLPEGTTRRRKIESIRTEMSRMSPEATLVARAYIKDRLSQ